MVVEVVVVVVVVVSLIFTTNISKVYELRNYISFLLMLQIHRVLMGMFAAPAPRCPGRKPVCTTCLYASNTRACINEGYKEDCSAMNDVSLLMRLSLQCSITHRVIFL